MIQFVKLSKLILLFLLSSHVVDADKATAVNFLQQSGRVTIVNNKIGPNKLQNKVRVRIVSVEEVTGAGNKTGTGGPPEKRHSLESLDTQNFVLTVSSSAVIGGLKVEKVSLVTQAGGGGTVTLETYVFLENGTFSLGNGESYTVKENDVKFNVRLSNWTFCVVGTLCGDRNATANTTYIDVAIEAAVLQGRRDDGDNDDKNKPPPKSGPGKSSGNSNSMQNKSGDGSNQGQDKTGKGRLLQKGESKVDLGSNIPMYLSTMVQVDGVWMSMADGYPKNDTQGDGVRYIIRFPKFRNEAVYDPVVGYSAADQVTTTSGASSSQKVRWSLLSAIFLVTVFGSF